MHASCDATTIPIGTKLYTNNSALSYTLQGVYQQNDAAAPTVLGSLVYHNNRLQDCSIGSVQIQMRSLGRTAIQIAQQQTGALMTAFATCGIETADGLVNVNLTTNYELILDSVIPGWGYQTFVGRNKTDNPSLYLGEVLLTMYWIELTNAYNAENQEDQYKLYEGTLAFNRNQTIPNETDDIASLDYFTPGCFFVPFNGNGVETEVQYCNKDDGGGTVADLANGPGNANSPLPNTWIPGDSLSKALYFTILADLGQNDPSQPNLLTDETLLEHFTKNFTNITRGTYDKNHPWGENVSPPNTIQDYFPYTQAKNGSEYDLGIKASTLSISYLCQIPRPKPASSLVFAVLIADLVLLKGLWSLFTLSVGLFAEKNHPEMGYCKGCLKQKHQDDKLDGDRIWQAEKKGQYHAIGQAEEGPGRGGYEL